MSDMMAFTTFPASNFAREMRKIPRAAAPPRVSLAARLQPTVGCGSSALACNGVASSGAAPYVGASHAGGRLTLFLQPADHSAFLALGGEEGRVVWGSK